KYIASQPLHQSQKLLSEDKESSVFELNILISEELIRTVLGYAGEIEVLQPESLREILSERIHQMAAIYLK
ncbi:MAG: WYL domain-containing protein, partial [Crocinitomicaceae bacterium]|nr:WYL domain-containing protein [Crocinitomicaceae bacterium]